MVDARASRVPRKTQKLNRLLEYPALSSARLDKIDEALIERYVQERRKRVSPATVNRQLATLRRALRLAQEWKIIDRVPRIRLLPGERVRDFVLTREQERNYFALLSNPLRDVAILILDTGLRIGEALALEWADVHLDPGVETRFGYIRIREGKSRNAKRAVSLTGRVKTMLDERRKTASCPLVFATVNHGPYRGTYLNRLHQKSREKLKLPADFVLHSLRHTMLTRLGEAGVDAFTIMRIAGHSSIMMSQRYVHPSSEALGRAIERLEAQNEDAMTEWAQFLAQ
jgi:integrase